MTDTPHFIPAWRPIAEAPPAVQGFAEQATVSFGDSMAAIYRMNTAPIRHYVVARGDIAKAAFDRFVRLPPMDVLIAGGFSPESLVVSGEVDPAILEKLRGRAGTFMVMREQTDHLADAWHEISKAIASADGDEGGLVLACAMIERRRLRLGLPPISTFPEDAPVAPGARNVLAPERNDWPSGCHDPDSCARHRACMHAQCPRCGTDIRAAVEAATPREANLAASCGRRGGNCQCQQESECIHHHGEA